MQPHRNISLRINTQRNIVLSIAVLGCLVGFLAVITFPDIARTLPHDAPMHTASAIYIALAYALSIGSASVAGAICNAYNKPVRGRTRRDIGEAYLARMRMRSRLTYAAHKLGFLALCLTVAAAGTIAAHAGLAAAISR